MPKTDKAPFTPHGVYAPPSSIEEVNEFRRIRRDMATAICAGMCGNSENALARRYDLADEAILLADMLLRKLDE